MKTSQEKTEMSSGIPCEFKDISEWTSIDNGGERKKGRYSGSTFPIPEFGRKKWVVLAYLDIPGLSSLHAQGLNEQEIIESCVEYLNQPPPRKKYQRKNQKPLYGKLELLSYRFTEKNGERVCCISLVTDQRKNKNFWGAGQAIVTGKRDG